MGDQFYLTHNGGVTSDVLQILLDDTVTPKSFDDILFGLTALRRTRYLQQRTVYEVACAHYRLKNEGADTTTYSAIDDVHGYNENLAEPTSQYLIDVLKAYVHEHEKFMTTAFDSIPTFPVISLDHTFNISKRTKVAVQPPPPENTAPGSQERTRYVGITENATLIVMGANGQVKKIASHARCGRRPQHTLGGMLNRDEGGRVS
jgi:hypothetical protein